jgi:hypothetical protein
VTDLVLIYESLWNDFSCTNECVQSQSQDYFMTDGLLPTSSSWRQAPWDLRQVILFSNWTLAVIVVMKYFLWIEDGSVVCNCCWSSPGQSFSGPSPAGLMTTFDSLRFETPPNWGQVPHEQGVPVIPPGTGIPFRRLLRLTGLRRRYSIPPPHGSECLLIWTAAYIVLRYPWTHLLIARILGIVYSMFVYTEACFDWGGL